VFGVQAPKEKSSEYRSENVAGPGVTAGTAMLWLEGCPIARCPKSWEEMVADMAGLKKHVSNKAMKSARC